MVKQLGPAYLPFVCEVLQSGEGQAGSEAARLHVVWGAWGVGGWAGLHSAASSAWRLSWHLNSARCALHPCPLSPCAACPPKGYLAHVLGYTVHAVVEAVAAVGQPGCVDDCLLLLLPLMEASGGLLHRAGPRRGSGRRGQKQPPQGRLLCLSASPSA